MNARGGRLHGWRVSKIRKHDADCICIDCSEIRRAAWRAGNQSPVPYTPEQIGAICVTIAGCLSAIIIILACVRSRH